MRTWGRYYPTGGPEDAAFGGFSFGVSPFGYTGEQPYWAEVSTDANGFNDAVWLTTLAQCILLNLGESPFYSNYGIPAQQSVVTQVLPDYYVALLQQQFGPYFASLIVARLSVNPPKYNVNVIPNAGAVIPNPLPY